MKILTFRPGWESNPCIRVLQTHALPLGDLATYLWALRDLNPRPAGCKPDALPLS